MSDKYAVVVGAVNVDIGGKSLKPLIPRDSNPGEISYSMGGVGRNIAHNMCLMGMRVQLLTAIGGDIWAQRIQESCRSIGIGLDKAVFAAGASTGTYLYITGPDGDMALAVSDMEAVRYISPEAVERALDFLNAAELVVFDGNLCAETIQYLCSHVTAPLFADPVSVTKGEKLKPYLSAIHTLKPNTLEAEALTGERGAEACARALLAAGVKRVFVSDGADGIVCAQGERCVRVPCRTARLVNATGGGDATMAAICRAFSEGYELEETGLYAMAAGAIAVEAPETINPAMSHELVLNRMK